MYKSRHTVTKRSNFPDGIKFITIHLSGKRLLPTLNTKLMVREYSCNGTYCT